MSISLKVLEKAIAAKDLHFLVPRLTEKLREYGWTDADIARLAEKLAASVRRSSGS